MRRPGGPPASRRGAWSSLRPFVLPVALLVAIVLVFTGGWDGDIVRAALAERRLDEALALLSSAGPGDLDPALAGIDWHTARTRSQRIAALRALSDEELYEYPETPTFVAPLGSWQQPPREVRLREAAPRDLDFRLVNQDLNLEALARPVTAGTSSLPLEVTLIPGTTFVMTLSEQDGGPVVTLDGFHVLSATEAEAARAALAAARAFAPDPDTGRLLAAIVALDLDLTTEALGVLELLEQQPAFARIARELATLALLEQGLDRSALARLER